MPKIAFQDAYPDLLSYCYGCGRLNPKGLQIKTRWDGEETVTIFTPRPEHIAVPGYVYGGLLASLIDCHSTGTASAAAHRSAGLPEDTPSPFRFLTASLKVDFLKPTPLGIPLEIRGKVEEIKGRKVIVHARIIADGQVTVTGQVVAVQVPDEMIAALVKQNQPSPEE